MSQGIGSGWLKKWKTDVYPHDWTVINGKKVRPPKFYDRILLDEDPKLLQKLKGQRIRNAKKHSADNTKARLAVREECQEAKAAQLKRNHDQ